jgi:GNAT superfamily N-acetyltransferase
VSLHVREAASPDDYAAMALCIADYIDWMRTRYGQAAWVINAVLDQQSLSSELTHLDTHYGPPNGRAFVALSGETIVGCGAYRTLGEGICEMKRVFVQQAMQGQGLGARLCETLIAFARSDGFTQMRLDTGDRMIEAIALYRKLGFEACAPYADYPPQLLPSLRVMALKL